MDSTERKIARKVPQWFWGQERKPPLYTFWVYSVLSQCLLIDLERKRGGKALNNGFCKRVKAEYKEGKLLSGTRGWLTFKTKISWCWQSGIAAALHWMIICTGEFITSLPGETLRTKVLSQHISSTDLDGRQGGWALVENCLPFGVRLWVCDQSRTGRWLFI